MAKKVEEVRNARHTNPRLGSITAFVFALLKEQFSKDGTLVDYATTQKAVLKEYPHSKYDKRHYAYYKYHFLRNQAIWKKA